MTEQQVKDYFGNTIIYSFTGKLDDLKAYQKENKNTSNYLKMGKTIYFTSVNECVKPDVVIAFDNREVA